MSDKTSVGTLLFALLGILVAIPAMVVGEYLLSGWVLVYLWGWFVVPGFHRPALRISEAIGLAIVVSYLTYQIQPETCKKSLTL
jgi:hypothetical protein